ncbi:MAG: prepilin-type N-terminal cleavage/methylation domain-containing protein [Pseudomonadota bacterium]
MKARTLYKKTLTGFTMVELIMVMVLIGILGATAQSIFSTDVFEERYLYDEVQTAIRYGQRFAITTGCKVKFDITSTQYTLNLDAECTSGNAADYTIPVEKPFEDAAYTKTNFPSGIAVTPLPNEIIFYPEGWGCDDDGNSSTTKTIVFTGEATRTLNFVCSTGYLYDS